MNIFFEYEKKHYNGSFLESDVERESFKKVLNSIWKERNQFGLASVYFEDEDHTEQQFFSFYDTYVQAGKYIGCIKYGNNVIHMMPKTLENGKGKYSTSQLLEMSNKNLLWWLSRCSKINFPKTFSGWNTRNFSFLDILIHLFATLTRDDLIYNKHQSYVEKEESIGTLRGRIDFSKFASNYFTGNAHILPCIYDSLEIDNLFNQIIKFTSRLLLQNTDNDELKKTLWEIIWILDDVEDVFINASDCDRVIVSPLNDNMKIIKDYCRMFLSGMSIKSNENDLEIFTFLIPTEKLFEDFLFGFIKDRFQFNPNIRGIQKQTDAAGNQIPLALEKDEFGNLMRKSFRLKPDIYVSMESKDIILDSKYKTIYSKEEAVENNRNKNGVSVSDIYQMLAYTVKLEVNDCHLIYPEIIGINDKLSTYYEIKHNNEKVISKVYYHRISSLIDNNSDELTEVIAVKEEQLLSQINSILNL